jgi:6-phosphofructokinase 1
MNAAIRAVVRAALARGWRVSGIRRGYTGLLEGDSVPLAARDVGGIVQLGGTLLGSARSPQMRSEEGLRTALARLAAWQVDDLVVIGGNGSQSGAAALAARGARVVGVASTIDNDLAGTDLTIGTDSAIQVTLEAIDRLRTTASSHRRAFLVETMGRDCGYIALMAGLAGGAEVIVVPEQETPPEEVAARLRAAYARGKTHALAVVAEGARHDARALAAWFDSHRADTGFGIRLTQLGHVVRGAAPTASDRLLATRLGAAAVEALAAGRSGMLIGIADARIGPTAPLADIAGRTKAPDLSLLELARTLAQ